MSASSRYTAIAIGNGYLTLEVDSVQPPIVPPPAEDVPALTSGLGFVGATTVPDQAGSAEDDGYDAMVIAHWLNPSFDTITGTVKIGVWAKHLNGIASVSFSLNGGAWVTPSGRTLQIDALGTTAAYWASIDSSALPDVEGNEIRAIITPSTAGISRVLQGDATTSGAFSEKSLWLSSNNGGTLNVDSLYVDATSGNDTTGNGTDLTPYQTIQKAVTVGRALTGNGSGLRIYLKAGAHTLTSVSSGTQGAIARWVTIEPAPGVARADAILVGNGSGGSLRVRLLKLANLTCRFSNNSVYGYTGYTDTLFWLDNCDIYSTDGRDFLPYYTGRWNSTTWSHPGYVTRSTVRDYPGAAFVALDLVRECAGNTVTAQTFKDVRHIIDCTADDLKKTDASQHTDCVQWTAGSSDSNYSVCGLIATDQQGQPLFSDAAITNVAIENVLVVQTTDLQYQSDFGKSTTNPAITHLLIENVSLPNTRMTFSSTSDKYVDCLVHGCVAYRLPTTSVSSHVMDEDNDGTIDNDPGFVGDGDYSPDVGSALLAGCSRRTPVDVEGTARATPTAIGAYAGSAE